jgi:hypothetical protein
MAPAVQRPRLDLDSAARLARLADCVVPFCIRIASSLDIAGHLARHPRSVVELADGTGTDAASLLRVMRALTSAGLVRESADGRFGLPQAAGDLPSQHLPFAAAEIRAWAACEDWVRGGDGVDPGFQDHENGGRAGCAAAFAIRLACGLRVADELAAGPRPAAELAGAAGAPPERLQRVLRTLAVAGVLTEPAPGRFELAGLGQLLRRDHRLGLGDLYTLIPAEIRAWSALDHSVRTGEAAFDRVHGQGLWDYLAVHAGENARFTAAQRAVTRLELRALLGAYDWSSVTSVVDVGGADGTLLAALLARFGRLRGTLLDLPAAVAGGEEVLAAAGVRDRAEVLAGSFLGGVPSGADAYILKRVLYCWRDEAAVELLRSVRRAMRPDSRLLVLEPVSRPASGFDAGTLLDVLLMVLTGAGARSAEQLEALFHDAGLELVRVVSTAMLPLVEARPAS